VRLGTESSERVPGGVVGLREVLRREAEVRGAADRESFAECVDPVANMGRRCEAGGGGAIFG
jgi:hypothetical protein